jgi:Flp pilus assembly protein TadG
MSRIFRFISRRHDQSGATAIIVAIVLSVLIGFTALAVDVGYLMTAKNELQNVADAAALAAARRLAANYAGLSYDEQQNYVCNPVSIRNVAKDISSKNKAGAKNISLNDVDIVIGQWDGTTRTLTPTLNQPDAVRVIARRDAEANGPIGTFFARILGIDTVGVIADATAAVTGQGTTEPGEVELPVGISKYWFTNNSCNDEIKFSPTKDPDACAGWTAFTENPNDATLRKILDEIISSPATTAGATQLNFIGGDLSKPTFDALLTLFQKKGYDVDMNGDPILDFDDNPMTDATGHPDAVPLFDDEGNPLLYPDDTPRNQHAWRTTVVVYNWDDCDNPNTSIEIAGYAYVRLTDVVGPPDKLIKGKVECNYISSEDNRGGGGNYGIQGSIPGLVE